MSSVNVTYWAILTTEGELWSGASGRINGLYSTERRAAAYLKLCLERQERWAEQYRDNPKVGPKLIDEYEDMKTWRVVPVRIVEVTRDGDPL